MIRLTNWTARRSGATITVTGLDAETKRPIKYAGVDTIIAKLSNGRAGIFAEREHDMDVELLIS